MSDEWHRLLLRRAPGLLILYITALSSLAVASGSSLCPPEIVAPCVSRIIPFHDYEDAFPVIEYCTHPTRGFLAGNKEACLELAGGNWTVRPDWAAVNATLEEQYNCAVCREYNASWQSPNSASIWLLNVVNTTVIKASDFEKWAKVLKSKVDQIVVAPSGKRYLYVLGTFKTVASLKKSYPKTFLLGQPVPPELKISPRLLDPGLAPPSQGNDSLVIKVKTLISSRTAVSARAMDTEHLEGLRAIRAATDTQAWCMETNCTVETLGKGTYAISNVDPEQTYDLAINVSSSLATIYLVDVRPKYKPFNVAASVISQSGTNATLGGSTTLWSKGGLTGNGVVVGVGDTGLDHTSCFFYDPNYPITFSTQYNGVLGGYFKVFSSSGHRKIREYFAYADNKEGTNGGHGTHVCGTVGGYPAQMSATSSAFKYQGMAYKAKIAFFDVGTASSDYLSIPSDMTTSYFPRTYDLGGRLHSNSWGSDDNDNSDEMYQSDYYLYQNQDFLIFYAAGNAGNGTFTVGTPAVAKNPVAVGATDNYLGHPDVSDFSSRGPTYDYRFKPDICSTGDPVWSAYSQASGTANQCYIVSMSGTSMATPTVAGNAALLVEYFTKGYYPLGYANPSHTFTPMGALVKAMLINSGRQMTGKEATRHNSASVTFPNWDQGFGYIALKYSTYLQGAGVSPNVLFVDGMWSSSCASCPTFTTSGQSKKYYFVPTKSTALRITLVWHDYPAAATLSSTALINDLDLTAKQGSTSYYANGQSSTSGYNAYNNVEQITIKTPTVGSTVTVTVKAYSLTTTQPYSLVVTGAFRRDYRNFNDAIPKVDVIATDGKQALFVGKNLPASSGFNYTINMTCLNPGPSTKISATVLQYSSVATYLAATLSTTDCKVYRVKVISDGFIGNKSAALIYGSVNISTYCDTIAYDQTCWSLNACVGKCKLPSEDKEKKDMDVLTLVTLIVAVTAAAFLCCAGGFCFYYFCCKKKQTQQARVAARRLPPVDGQFQPFATQRGPESPQGAPPAYGYPGAPVVIQQGYPMAGMPVYQDGYNVGVYPQQYVAYPIQPVPQNLSPPQSPAATSRSFAGFDASTSGTPMLPRQTHLA